MSHVTPRPNNSVSDRFASDFTRREATELGRRERQEIADGIVAATRIQAAGWVTAIAIQSTAMLSREAQIAANGDERAAERLEHIVDGFAMYSRSAINRFVQ